MTAPAAPTRKIRIRMKDGTVKSVEVSPTLVEWKAMAAARREPDLVDAT